MKIRFVAVIFCMLLGVSLQPVLASSTWKGMKKDFRQVQRHIKKQFNDGSSSSQRTPASTSEEHGSAATARKFETQFLLEFLGYDVGKADGIIGARTRSAIRAFQQDQQLPLTGQVSDELVQHLRDELQRRTQGPKAAHGAPAAQPPALQPTDSSSFDISTIRIDQYGLGMTLEDYRGKTPGARIFDNGTAGLLSLVHKSNNYSLLFYFERNNGRLYRIEAIESSSVDPLMQSSHVIEKYGEPTSSIRTDGYFSGCWGHCGPEGVMQVSDQSKALQVSIDSARTAYSLVDMSIQTSLLAGTQSSDPTRLIKRIPQASDYPRTLEFDGYSLGMRTDDLQGIQPEPVEPNDTSNTFKPIVFKQTLTEGGNEVIYHLFAHPANEQIYLIQRGIRFSQPVDPATLKDRLIRKYGQPNGFGQGKNNLCWGECAVRVKHPQKDPVVIGAGAKFEIEINDNNLIYWLADGDIYEQAEAKRKADELQPKSESNETAPIPESIL